MSGANHWSETISQRFNDDLLLAEDDRRLAAAKFPSLYPVLDHPELRTTFAIYEKGAIAAKHSGRIFGICAISLGAIALMASAAEPIAHQFHGEVALALLGGTFGLASVYLGLSKALAGKTKRNWLLQRFAAERIRQWHFEDLVYNIPDYLLAIRHGAQERYLNQRRNQFETFRAQFLQKLDSHFTGAISERGVEYTLLHDGHAHRELPIDEESFGPIADAYRELRIKHQADYASYKLSESQTAASLLPTGQAKLFELVGSFSIGFLLLTHFLTVSAVAYAYVFGGSSGHAQFAALLPVAAMWIAIVSVAVGAFERGLQPERELERYTSYLHSVEEILRRFDASAQISEKIEIMQDMERLAYSEMREFLRTFIRTKFVI